MYFIRLLIYLIIISVSISLVVKYPTESLENIFLYSSLQSINESFRSILYQLEFCFHPVFIWCLFGVSSQVYQVNSSLAFFIVVNLSRLIYKL